MASYWASPVGSFTWKLERRRVISEDWSLQYLPLRLIWVSWVPGLKIAAPVKIIPSLKLSLKPILSLIFSGLEVKMEQFLLQFCTILSGFPTPAHTFVNNSFIKPFPNYPDLSMPSVSCWALTDTYAKHVGLSIWFVWWWFLFGLWFTLERWFHIHWANVVEFLGPRGWESDWNSQR